MCVRGVWWDKPESEKRSEGDQALKDCEEPACSAARLSFAPACSLFFRRSGLSLCLLLSLGSLKTQCLTVLGPGSPWLSEKEMKIG